VRQPTVWMAAIAALVSVVAAVPPQAAASGAINTGCRRLSAISVAMIDTGIDPLPSLSPSVDWKDSRSFVTGEGPRDGNGHGTEMAAIVHRMAPMARLLDVKALGNQGDGRQSILVSAIRFAVDRGARIINLSVAGAATDSQVRSAIAFAASHGVLVVTAAGNEGSDIDRYPSYPAAYRLPNLLAVAASDGTGALIASSDYGRRDVTLAAPGLDVPTVSDSGAPIAATGTSPAAAEVSGVAALALAEEPWLSVPELRDAVVEAGTRAPSLAGETSSGRWLDPARARASFHPSTSCTPTSREDVPGTRSQR